MTGTRMAVVTTAHPWGDPRVFGRELEACLDWGMEVDLFAQPPPGGLEGGARAGLRFHPLAVPAGRGRRLLQSLRVWREVLRHGPFRLIHFHDPELLPAMALLTLLEPGTYFLYDIHEDLPLQFEAKGYLPPWSRRPLAMLASWALGLARRLFHGFAPATEAIARDWPPEATRVVHNYPKALFSVTSPEPDPTRVLYMGGLARGRGILLALEAMRLARRTQPSLSLELVGWVMEPEVGQAIAEACGEGWCLHRPRLEAEALAAFAEGAGIGLVTLLPQANYLEALPTKLFEYMALGIPVLASDFPLWRGLVEASGAGRLVRPEPEAVAQTLVAMSRDPAGLQVHALRGRAAYLEHYRWEAEAPRLRWHLARAGAVPPGPP